jgi:hypothetical protein
MKVIRLRLGKGDKHSEWCELQVELRDTDKGPELSICGSAGYVVTVAQARRDALQYWTDFFDDSPADLVDMNRRFNRRFTSSRGAAKFVLDTDGEFHGLDVHMHAVDRSGWHVGRTEAHAWPK